MDAAAAAASAAGEAPRSSSSGSAADTYIGSLISLTSKSEIRYEGVLFNINTEESSIGLRNVRSFGTEGRKKDGLQVPPSDKVYEYILFRGSDIKDLQVKSSPTQTTAIPVHNDPAIIQTHYPQAAANTSTSLPTSGTGSNISDLSANNPQMAFPRPPFPGNLPLYQPVGGMGSWGTTPPPPMTNGSGVALPMYWQGFYGPSSGFQPPQQSLPSSGFQPQQQSLPSNGFQPQQQSLTSSGFQLQQQSLPSSGFQPQQQSLPSIGFQPQQQSLLRPPPGLSMPPSMQQPLQYPAMNTPLTSAASNMPALKSSESPSVLLPPLSSGSLSLQSSFFPAQSPPLAAGTLNLQSPLLPAQPSATLNLQSPLLPAQPSAIVLDPATNLIPNKASTEALPTAVSTGVPSISPLTSLDRTSILSSVSDKPLTVPTPIMQLKASESPSIAGISSSNLNEGAVPSLITPNQLLQHGLTTVSSTKPLQTSQRDVEVVQVSSSESQPIQAAPESQEPILPLPSPSDHQLHGARTFTRHHYRGGRGERGRGNRMSRPLTRFTEDFDFIAMNEKFNKDEVWGDLGKNKALEDENESQDEDDIGSSKVETKPVYVKDDFFDSLSCDALDHGSQNGRTRFSEQLKKDTETFGYLPRHRGGRGGGRGPGRGGRSGGYYGRGYGGGYVGRGRGHSYSSHTG
ncbi:hypothetical protein FNV43_RR13610 [Rhamnella rubrinervis]|uniref:Protein decapping 5 n=1 Tax=Rhamnella rubrinervis TaxID=2594499 RepID=A0A8K0H1H8_9ROSA|nr:hypothetical protein FNV43_RR13610 [Rhamnella rubrinervis]